MELDKEKYGLVLRTYTTLSSNKLEKLTAEAFAADVKTAVGLAQKNADLVVNAFEKPTEQGLELAKAGLHHLSRAVTPVAKHWRTFVEQASDVLGLEVLATQPAQLVPDVVALQRQLEDVKRDRDGWKEQHTNAMASWKVDVENLNAKNAALEAQLVAVVSAQPPAPIVLPAGTDLNLQGVAPAGSPKPPAPPPERRRR